MRPTSGAMLVVTNSRLSGWRAAIVMYAVVSLIALAGLLLTPGTVGHHWDWMLPSDPAELRRLASMQRFAWQDYGFGSYVTYRYATVFTSLLFGLPGYVGLTGAFVSKALVLLSVFVSGLGMRFLLLSLTCEEPGARDGAFATFGGLLFALAPYAYNQIVAGDQSALISDALSPIAIGLAVRSVFARDRMWLAYALASALLLAVIVASAQVFVFTLAVMWAVCLALRWSGRSALRLAALAAAAVGLCAFWILPVAVAGGALHTVVATSPIETAFATLEQFSNPLMTSTMLAFPGDFYLHALGGGAPAFFLAYAALVGLCVVALTKRRSMLLVVLGVMFVLTAVVPLGGNPVVGPAIIAIFRAFLPYSLFLRTPQHLMFVMALVVPMTVYLSARGIRWRLPGGLLAPGILIVIAYGQGFFVHSNFFGLIGPFRETAGERVTVASARAPGNEEYRTLFVPNSPSYYYHPAIFDYYFEGSDEPQIRFLPGMTMGAGVKWSPYDRTQELLKALDELVPDGTDAQTQAMLLKMAGVKHLVVHAIGVPTAGVRLTGQRGRPYLEKALGAGRIAVFEASSNDRSLWRFGHPVTRIYAPDCVFGVSPRSGPYDVLALAPAAASCARPATVASPASDRSEEVISAATFRSSPDDGIALPRPQANVETEAANGGHGFFSTVPPGVQDVQMFALPPVPRRATGISFRMFFSAPRRVYVQLYAPDSRNVYQTNVDFSGQVLDVALNFRDFGKIGNPNARAIKTLRFASDNPHLRDAETYFGAFGWIYRTRRSIATPYLAMAGNRWDTSYFGGDRDHVLFVPSPVAAPAYVAARIPHDGTYDVLAHVQDVKHELSLRVSVDGRNGPCSPGRTPTDETERLVRLARLPLRAGRHAFELRYCGRAPAPTHDAAGVQSLIVASARLAPPARRTAGTALILNQRPGKILVRALGNVLVFSDSYDDRWTASQDGLPLRHVVANGYANGWLVPNPKAGEVILSFWPQRYFEMGVEVSLLLAALSLAAIASLVLSARTGSGASPPASTK
ncbi:MAG: hypothetical protein ABI231_11405 [Candidatus Tumulicola sp.]